MTFTDSVMELNLENPSFRGGGTAFSPIEQHIRGKVMPKHKNKYPSSVVIITDGQAYWDSVRPEDQNKSNWLWLLVGHNPVLINIKMLI